MVGTAQNNYICFGRFMPGGSVSNLNRLKTIIFTLIPLYMFKGHIWIKRGHGSGRGDKERVRHSSPPGTQPRASPAEPPAGQPQPGWPPGSWWWSEGSAPSPQPDTPARSQTRWPGWAGNTAWRSSYAPHCPGLFPPSSRSARPIRGALTRSRAAQRY